MENKVLGDIKKYIINRLQQEYGYCGCAEGASMIMLNSGNDTNIIINIKETKD